MSNIFQNLQLQRIADAIENGEAGGGTLTINLTGVGDMQPATASTAGVHGLVPAPAPGDENKILSGAGTWIDSGSDVDIGDLENVTITSPKSGESLKYNGSKWVNGNVMAELPDFIEETSGSIVTVNASERTAKSLKVAINPVQSGSGDPSPENIRPISGWTECNVVVSPTTDAEDGTTYHITFPSEAGTVYGGTLDVVNGTLTVERAYVDMGTLTWAERPSTTQGGGYYMRTTISGIRRASSANKANTWMICERYKISAYNSISGTNGNIGYAVASSDTSDGVIAYNPNYNSSTSGSAFKSAVAGVKLVYGLSTPITYQFTPTEVQMLLGTNNIWADTGEVKELKYIPQTYNDLLEEVTGGYDITTNGAPVKTGITWDGYPVKCFCVRYYNLSLNTNAQDISLAEYGFSDTINGLFKVDCMVQSGSNTINVTPHVHYDGNGWLRGRYDTSESFTSGTGFIFMYYY